MGEHMHKIWVCALTVALVFLAGCASGPKFNTVESGLSSLPTGKARIFLYRSTSLGAGIQPEIKLNGAVVGKAEPNGIFFVDRDPGNMEVVTSSEVEKKLTFTVSAGETRYVRLGVGLGVLVYRIIPELVAEDEARKEIAELAYTGSSGMRK
jgi:hypothetical protein